MLRIKENIEFLNETFIDVIVINNAEICHVTFIK